MTDTFVSVARAQTMLRDFEAHRKAVRSGDFAAIDQTWDHCERWVDQLRPDIADALEAAQQRIAELEAEVQRCHERLEIDRYYAANEAMDDFKTVHVPMEERSTMTDGIECRDITIQLLEEDNAALVEELRARKALEGK